MDTNYNPFTRLNTNNDIIYIQPSGDDLYSPERIARQKARGPQRGDLWLAEEPTTDPTENNCEYVTILQVHNDNSATVCPISNDVRTYDDGTLQIVDTPLDQPMIAYPNLVSRIPTKRLYKPLKNFTEETIMTIERMSQHRTPINLDCFNDDFVCEMVTDMIMHMLMWHYAYLASIETK